MSNTQAVCERQVLDVHPWHYDTIKCLSLGRVVPVAHGTQGTGITLVQNA